MCQRCPRTCVNHVSSLYTAAKKVSAAPHRGEANRPLRNQGKANTPRTTTKAPQAKKQLQNPSNHRQNHRQNKRRHKRKRIFLPEQPKGDIPGHPPNPNLAQPGPTRRQNGHSDKRSQQPPDHRKAPNGNEPERKCKPEAQTNPNGLKSKSMRPVATGKRIERLLNAPRKRNHLEQLPHLRLG
jgi:hypothetical protein